jgi:hypothetical protein
MPFVPAPQIIELEFRYTMGGQQAENRVMVDNLAAVEASDLEEVAILGWNWWEDTYGPNVGNNTALREVVCTDLTASDGGQFTYAPSTGVAGSKSPILPNESAFCISLHSASRGRSARGRWFAGSLSANDRADANTLTAVYVNDFVTALQALINAISTSGRALVIVSYRHNNAPRPGGPVYYPVTAAVAVDAIIDSQRRRKPGVGA